MGSARIKRIDAAIKEVLGVVLANGLKDPRIGFVTVTEVKTSPDLRTARVFVSGLRGDGAPPTPFEREELLAGLRSAHGYLQYRLARELRIKRTPILNFHYDETPERAARLAALLEQELPREGGAP